MTRTSHRWQSKPGSFDALHATQLFPADNAWGIPVLAHTPVSRTPDWLVPYRQRIRANESGRQGVLDDGCVHFFLDDYRFETVWNRPYKALAALAPYRMLLTPDFSLYRDWPLTLQLWNVYRNRWCGRFWQEKGFTVIPTVSWSTAVSYDFCFLGVPRRSMVAVSGVGVNLSTSSRQAGDAPLEYQLFVDGFAEMVRRLEPLVVLSYGRLPAVCHQLVQVVTYPTRWTNIRAARRDDPLTTPEQSLLRGKEAGTKVSPCLSGKDNKE